MSKFIIVVVIAFVFFSVQSKSAETTTGSELACIIGESWTDGCNNFTCSENGPSIVNKNKIMGCKSKCYKAGDQVQLDLCSIVECGDDKKFKVIKLGCIDGQDCKKKGEKWAVSKDGECKSMRCVVNFRRNKFITKTTETKSSKYCKEESSDTCHKKKDKWYEYSASEGKCNRFKCTNKGSKTLKKSKACAHEGQCILNRQKAPRKSRDDPLCRCQDGRMVCLKPAPKKKGA